MAKETMLVPNVIKHSVQNALSKNIMSAEHKKKWHAYDECDKTFATKEHLSDGHMKTAQKQPEAVEPDVPNFR